MLITILLLIFTIVVVPIVCFYFGTDTNLLQDQILYSATTTLACVIAYCFIVGELSRNNSQVDKLWSIVPIAYVWQMTALAGMNERMVLMSVLVTIWGIRLTYNFARRGAYTWKFWSGEEDYRWEELRKRPGFSNKFIWMLFDLFFICGYQNVLIFLFTLPVLTSISTDASETLGIMDWLLAIIFTLLVIIEFIADQQQYDFQTEKYRRIKEGIPLEKYERGFVSEGLWSFVRHPNYACEQAIWVVFYLFSVVATGQWINWSIAGCLLLIILFKGSSDFSEEISSRKYADYKKYQEKVPRFIPFAKGFNKSGF